MRARNILRKTFALFFVIVLACSLFFTLSIKPASASTNQIYWGAFVGPSHIGTLAELEAFEQTVGKGVSIWSIFQYWDRPQDSENDPNFDTSWMNTCRAHGAIPEIAFDPGDGSSGAIANTYFPLIIQGYYDNFLINWARNASAWRYPFFIRLFHEVDDVTWTATLENEEVQAWIHVVNIFREYGANNVSWIWSGVCYMYNNNDIATTEALYPGDNYVDWSGIAGYSGTAGTTFDQMFQTYYNNSLAVAPTKPIMIVEVGLEYDASDEAAWWTNALTNELPNYYPQVKALVIWQMPPIDVTGSTVLLSAFQHGIASSYYSSNVYGSLNISPITALGENPNSTSTPTSQPTSTPTYIGSKTPTPSPTLTSKSSPVVVSSGLGWSDVVIIVVIAAMAVVAVLAVAPKISLRRKCLKEVERRRAIDSGR